MHEVQPEGFDLKQHHEAYSMLLSVIAFAHLDDDERAHVVELLQQSSDLFANAQKVGVNATVSQFIGMHGQRGRYRALFREFFRNFDVLLAPVTITPAFPHISDPATDTQAHAPGEWRRSPLYVPPHLCRSSLL